MFNLPILKRLEKQSALATYAAVYQQCSGLNVPQDYLQNNQVFGIEIKGKLIGGFILGCGAPLRTVDYFARKENQYDLYEQIGAPNTFTEICCFWIDPVYRTKTLINYFVWVCMAYTLKRFGKENIIFGTNSRRLAALYSTTAKSIFLHSDKIGPKRTFIYVAKRKTALRGILEIVYFKFKRQWALNRRTNRAIVATKRKSAAA